MWCGAPPSSEGAQEASGSACQGHYKSYMKEEDNATRVAIICEGGHSWISRKVSICPHDGKTYKTMMGSMHAGASLSMMSFPSHEDDGSSSSALNPAATPGAAAGLTLVQQTLDGVPALVTARKQIKESMVEAEDGKFELESHAHGFHVSWRATKQVAPSDAASQAMPEWDELEADAKDTIGPSWADWLPGHASGPPRDHDGAPPTMTCNDQPAWWHGALPCWGNFSISATRTESSKPCTGNKASLTTTKLPTRALRAGAHGVRLHVEDLPQAVKAPALKGGVTSSMTAECDGLWTGFFMTCHGVSTWHAQVKRDEEHDMDKRTICTGRQGLHFIHKPNVYGMSVTCKGDSVMALRASIRPRTAAVAA